jgi:hypothetical protein
VCRLPDFEAYLSFVEHSIQHLQFVVWYQSYRERFFALPEAVQALSPPPSASSERQYPPSVNASKYDLSTSTTLSSEGSNLGDYSSVPGSSPGRSGFAPPGLSPFSSAPTIVRGQQPFRPEIARIVATFLAPNALKSLLLPDGLKDEVPRALAGSTHPDVLAPAYDVAMATLRGALPRFLAQSVVVTNRPKQLFWYCMSVVWVMLGIAVVLVTMFATSHGSNHLSEWHLRGLRLVALPFVYYGTGMAIMSAQSFCLKISDRGQRQLRPWELEAASLDTRTWWAGLTGEANTVHDMEDTPADDLAEAESGLARVQSTSEAVVELPASLTLRARRQARRVRDKLLGDLSTLDMASRQPLLKSKNSALSSTNSPVTISFTRTTTVEVDDSSRGAEDKVPSPYAITDAEHTLDLPDLQFSSDSTETGDFDKTLSLSTPRLPKRLSLPSKRPRPPTVFGPEKVVLDPRVLAAHKQIKLFTFVIALVPTLVSTAPLVFMVR